jgi:hypothetical protein
MGPLLRKITGANFSEGLCTVRGSPADWGKTSARFQSGQIGAVGSVLFHHFTGISTPPEERDDESEAVYDWRQSGGPPTRRIPLRGSEVDIRRDPVTGEVVLSKPTSVARSPWRC